MSEVKRAPVLIRSLGLAGWPEPDGSENCWLSAFDPDADNPVHPGQGLIGWTPDPRKAIVYPDLQSAMAAWKQPSTRVPLRPDGEPNRPLTAYSVTFDLAPPGPEHR